MLSLVTAAEHQYRNDARIRDRELAVLASIRARQTAELETIPPAAVVLRRRRQVVWARPIGRRAPAECAMSAGATT